MKSKTALLLAALCLCTVCAAGCDTEESGNTGTDETYTVYTNIPESLISDLSENFTLSRSLEGGYEQRAAEAYSGSYGSLAYTYWGVMNTDAYLTVSADFTDTENYDAMTALIDEVGTLLYGMNASLSVTAQTSYISQFNAAAAGAKVEIDAYAYNVLSLALDMYELTDGYYNPAVYYSVTAYGFSGGSYPQSPSDLIDDGTAEKYVSLASHFGEIVLEEENGSYYATKPNAVVTVGGETLSLAVDLGGIAKGYAADMVDKLTEGYGFEYGYFNFGSSSIALKRSAAKGSYTVGLIDPRNAGGVYMALKAADVCISTSGDYENYYELDGVRYCHIIDPATGKPVQTGIMSATVIGGSAAENDALTTAIMAMGKERAIAFINSKLSDRLVAFTYEG